MDAPVLVEWKDGVLSSLLARPEHLQVTQPPVNVGAPVNSSVDDFCPTIDRDGHRFFFVSRRNSRPRSLNVAPCRSTAAMCATSNMPQPARTARCSSSCEP